MLLAGAPFDRELAKRRGLLSFAFVFLLVGQVGAGFAPAELRAAGGVVVEYA